MTDTYLRILNQIEALYPNASPELLSAAARNATADYLKAPAAQLIDLQARREARRRMRAG